MDTNSVIITYSSETIRAIGENITATLDPEIIKNLLEIKINNRFIRKRSPIKLRYSMGKSAADTWRKEKEEEDISKEDQFQEALNSNLNKLSEGNYALISEKILEVIKNNLDDDKYKTMVLEIILNKSISEQSFSTLYAKLIKDIIEIYGEEFQKSILKKTEDFYENNIIKTFTYDQSNISYDEMCKINKQKKHLIGSFTFIGCLYKHEIVGSDLVLKYFNTLQESTITNSSSNDIEKYIECLTTLVSTIGGKMEEEEPEEFNEKIINPLEQISKDKTKFKPRSRFMVLDLFDLRKRNWEQ